MHSSSLREQVPLWNCRHTSRVSHFVSRIDAIFIAMSVAGEIEWRLCVLVVGGDYLLGSWFRVKIYNTELTVFKHATNQDLLQFWWWGLSLLSKLEVREWQYLRDGTIGLHVGGVNHYISDADSDKAEGTYLEGSSARCTSVPKMSLYEWWYLCENGCYMKKCDAIFEIQWHTLGQHKGFCCLWIFCASPVVFSLHLTQQNKRWGGGGGRALLSYVLSV